MIRVILRILYYVVIFWIVIKIILIFKKKKEDERKHPFFKYGVDEHYQKDKLVKDNYCNTYIPQGKAISLNYDGQLLYFCSEECRDKFIEALKRKHNN